MLVIIFYLQNRTIRERCLIHKENEIFVFVFLYNEKV